MGKDIRRMIIIVGLLLLVMIIYLFVFNFLKLPDDAQKGLWSGFLIASFTIWKIITVDLIIFVVSVLFVILMVLMKVYKHKYKRER